MALNKTAGGGNGRRPSNRGVFYQYVRNGLEITARWPSKVNRNKSPAALERQEYFRQVQWAFKYSDPSIQRDYTEAVAHTPLLPRDLFNAAIYGRLLRIRTPEGLLYVSVQAMSNVSETLDFITSVPGSILIRASEGWVGLSPANAGDVLTLELSSGLPAWAPASGGGGDRSAILPLPGTGELQLNTTANWGATTSLLLTDVWPQQDTVINRLHLPTFAADLNAIIRPVVYDWGTQASFPSATTDAMFIEDGPEQQFSGRGVFVSNLDNPVTLTAGRIYLIGYMKRSATTNYGVVPSVQNRRIYTTTTVYAAPPNLLPAMTQGNSTIGSFWKS